MEFDLNFYRGRRVFLTGHTGFKGSWLTVLLRSLGAEVVGYSTCRDRAPRLFDLCGAADGITQIQGDVRDFSHLLDVFREYRPEVVLHLAAQPIVRESYRDPVVTYSTNVMGTVNLLEAVRQTDSVRSVLNVTTDKVYKNKEWIWGYRETEELDGYDPYSNSKSCSELVTHSFQSSFFVDGNVAVSTARAGNVIGGGDFAADRLLPDCVRAVLSREEIVLRNPASVRPFQHVLEPLFAYLMIAARQYEDSSLASSYNVGPDEADCVTAGKLAELFCKYWGEGAHWTARPDGGPHEAGFLKLDCSKLRAVFGWHPRWDVERAVAETVAWTRVWQSGGDLRRCMENQIAAYLSA